MIAVFQLYTLSSVLTLKCSDGKFPDIFTCGKFPESWRIDFCLLIFYRNIYVSGNVYHTIYVFYSIIYVLGTFWKVSGNFSEIFITTNMYERLERRACCDRSTGERSDQLHQSITVVFVKAVCLKTGYFQMRHIG
jgi:hypothetical protein